MAWTGVTGFYHTDIRSPLDRDERKTWTPFCVWASPSYSYDTMHFTIQPGGWKCNKDTSAATSPPTNRRYLLQLIQVPDGIIGAPSVGTIWEVPLNNSFTVTLPTYRTTDGLTGYQLGFTVTEAEPSPCDFDNDGDVDGRDYGFLEGCMGGPDHAANDGCDPEDFAATDVNDDGRVDLADYSELSARFTGAYSEPPPFVGASACRTCHSDLYNRWYATRHATAFDTLIAAGEGDNPVCFPCHSVGYRETGGFVDLETTPNLANNQCEICHGPGGAHSADPDNVRIAVDLDADLCGSCHRSCREMCSDDYSPTYEQWSASKHAAALADIRAHDEFRDACLECHSTDYRLAPVDEKPTTYDAQLDIECVACHDPHGSSYGFQLRMRAQDVCSQCHTLDGARPGVEPEQGQSEMLRGEGGYSLGGVDLDGSESAHNLDIPERCVVCHMHREDPGMPADSGHTFEPDMSACGPCHDGQDVPLLVEEADYEIGQRLTNIAPYFDPASPLYIDPSGLDPGLLRAYYIAKFDAGFVASDRSGGTHNIIYARMLLSEAEAFIDSIP